MTHGSMIQRRSESLDMGVDGEMEMLRPLIFFVHVVYLCMHWGFTFHLPLDSTLHPSVGG